MIENIAPSGMKLRYKVRELLNINNWRREFKYNRQRKQRGWSDRDSWGTGDYLIRITAEMLEKLGDDKSHVDWKDYFKTNYPNNEGYKSLKAVAKDIRDFIAIDEKLWTEDLDFEIKHDWEELPDGSSRMVHRNTPEEERKITKAIQAYNKEWDRKRKKATKAMTFVAKNFPGLWD